MIQLIGILRTMTQRTRQHHAIEHATLTLLGERLPQGTFAGYSDPLGFTVYGDVDEFTLRRAVGDAMLRLQAGDHYLALHPNCGTNLATMALMATVAAMLGSGGRRSFPDRFGSALLLVVAALIAAKPIGMWLQSYTTSPHVADRWVADIRPMRAGSLRGHRILFA